MAQLATTTTAPDVADSPQRILLHRRGAVYLSHWPDATATPVNEPGVRLLEADLLDRRWLLDAQLRDALTRIDPIELVAVGSALLADCDALLGADRPHVPLFRNFPSSTPQNTDAFFVDRVLSLWFQEPDQPCVLCGSSGHVQPVRPCGHLVCSACFDGSDFSACPICHRRIDLGDPFLRPSQPRATAPAAAAPRRSRILHRRSRVDDDAIADVENTAAMPNPEPPVGNTAPTRLRVLHLGPAIDLDALEELRTLLGRTTALPPGDADNLMMLLGTRSHTDLSWVPAEIPGRETKARLLAWLVREPSTEAYACAGDLIDTATDVLRLLVTLSGGEPSLIDRPHFAAIPRPLRRQALAWLDRIDLTQLVEDVRRHERSWIRAAERLHPGEYAQRYPTAYMAFAVLRRTIVGDDIAGEYGDAVTVTNGRLRVELLGQRVEVGIAGGRTGEVAELLAVRRPGELGRRLDHVLRASATATERDRVLAALTAAVPTIAPAVLLAVLGQIRSRANTDRRVRVYFPADAAAIAHVVPDIRPLLDPATIDAVAEIITGELLRRTAALPAVDSAVIDADLDQVVLPFAQRTASKALVTLPRGTVLPLPVGRYLRLFCHWMQPEDQRVDLDLSVAFYDDAWLHVNTCDFTHLRVSNKGAVHSGDLTSAPAPLGASEFVDLDLDVLAGVARYAVMTVFSYNSIPFVDLPEAFAGWMLRTSAPGAGKIFDARAVEQRFDLAGPSKATLPMVIDLAERTARWLDVAPRVSGDMHAVHRHADTLSAVASAMVDTFARGSRVSAGEAARLIAAGRTASVLVRRGSVLHRYERGRTESVPAFARRLARPDLRNGIAENDAAAGAALHIVTRAACRPPAGADVYALHAADVDAAEANLLGYADLLTAFAAG